MSLFFETLRVEKGTVSNIAEHNLRLNKTIKSYFGIQLELDLTNYLQLPLDEHLYRCKVLYDTKIKDVQFYPYKERKIKSFKLINSKIKYNLKYADRVDIDNLFSQRDSADEIIIVDDNGYVKDTSIANIAIQKDGIWFTPAQPLLEGTVRNKLIKENILHKMPMKMKDIVNADSFAIMNAMIGFKVIEDEEIF